jgi:hypothetical protein
MAELRVVFCAHPLDRSAVDPDYDSEAAAVNELGLQYALVRVEPLIQRGDAAAAVRGLPVRGPGPALYRGWMLAPDRYHALHTALAGAGDQLVNTPEAYRHCHWLPESYAAIEPWTPRSAWVPELELSMDRVLSVARSFGSRPLVVKDYVKSRKHEWAEACFIPDGTNASAVERVVRRFLELTGDELQGGIVLREFVEFDRVGAHARSGMPLAREWRVFWFDREPVLVAPYWPEVSGEPPPVDAFREASARVESRFFTMDLAKRTDGEWAIVELGDGQVSGLPDGANPAALLSGVARMLS